ncbi:hypothetical protein VNO77_02716 [Canavalia gladiata]|uniref:Uncharacterized protein n=1 Tax=Canavalia gladiata TaxID=3824 RepID=A0AAN9R663_CANGL
MTERRAPGRPEFISGTSLRRGPAVTPRLHLRALEIAFPSFFQYSPPLSKPPVMTNLPSPKFPNSSPIQAPVITSLPLPNFRDSMPILPPPFFPHH